MSEIHYFPRYSQRENVVTNNTLLLLLRFRDYNRFKFEKLIELICVDEELQLATSWLQFRQQITTGKSVVDGYIAQDSIKIAVETKLVDSVDIDQLERHLSVFGSEQHKLLILLSPSLGLITAKRLEAIKTLATPRNIQVVHISFQDLIEDANSCLSPHDEELAALVSDYEAFCSDMDLLPADSYTMFVPPCGQSFKENIAQRLYYCPATWTRRNAKYLGIYKDKHIQAIGTISRVVSCDIDLITRTVVADDEAPLTPEERERVLAATLKARERGWDLTSGHKFFLCDTMEETSFRKTTPHGIMGHRYFNLHEVLGEKLPDSIQELASRLTTATWT